MKAAAQPYSAPKLALKYLQYYLTAANGKGHGIHSPFVFELVTRVFNDTTQYEAYQQVEACRKMLLQDKRMLEVADFGAGSATGATQQRRICDIAASALKKPRYGQLLYRLARFAKAGHMLELGTSLGITTAYLALANSKATVQTLEGAPAVAAEAQQVFDRLGITNTAIVCGNFDDTLAPLLQQNKVPYDLIYLDGNHRYEPTLRYVTALLPHVHNASVLVMDDIHWSAEMEAAWKSVQQHPAVRLTVDLFFIGLVFFRTEQKIKQHVTIRF
jgi:predicted O-methyltransferase YrrM